MSLTVHGLTYQHPDRQLLFHELSFSLGPGEQAALVGPNGVGKSTLLRLLAGELLPTAGTVTGAAKPCYVPQHLGQFDHLTLAQALGVAGPLRALHAILAGDADPAHFTALADDWELEDRIRAALAHWQLPPGLDLQQPLGTLSGGEKTKVFLAGVQLRNPALVLLDEPTNHLDPSARVRLHEYIQHSKATLLVVSHDRALLRQLPLTLELGPDRLSRYGGSYDFYYAQQASQLQALQAQAAEQAKTLRQTQQHARALAEQRHKQQARANAQGASKGLPRIVAGHLQRQAQQSTARLQETQAGKLHDLADNLRQLRARLHDRQPLALQLPAAPLPPGKVLAEARALSYTYAAGQPPLWPAPLTFQLRSGQRLRLAGPNGSGKTTLLRLLLGQLAPSPGQLTRADFEYLYLDQEYSLIDDQLTVLEQVQHDNARHLPLAELTTRLHQHHFPQARWASPCATLSGGEKLKLLLCCLSVGHAAPSVLVLDEPTNNLDLPSQQVLTRAVQQFPGTVLLISHDEAFVAEIEVTDTLAL
jgi:ATPase subunit of ABC transporter with duplicated ATPase domains